jgi:hypothetical protein
MSGMLQPADKGRKQQDIGTMALTMASFSSATAHWVIRYLCWWWVQADVPITVHVLLHTG